MWLSLVTFLRPDVYALRGTTSHQTGCLVMRRTSASQEMEAVNISAQIFQGRTNAAVSRDTNWQIMDLLVKVLLIFIDTLTEFLVKQSLYL